jgi:hypothetical protein
MSAGSNARYACFTNAGVARAVRRSAAKKAAADAAADAAAASRTVRKKGGEGLDAASAAAIEAVETERARQARRRATAARQLAEVPKLLVRRLDIFDLEKFRRLSRGARDCVRAEDELRKPKRSFAVLPLVLGWYSDDPAGWDGDSDLEEGYYDWVTRYVPCPEVALQLDDRRGEYVPAGGDARAEFTWAASYDMAAYDYDEREMAWVPVHEGWRTPRARAAPRGECEWGGGELLDEKGITGTYEGWKLRLYWRPAPEDGVELPPRWDRWDNALRSRGVRVPWNLRYGGSGVGLGLRYHVLEDRSEEWNGTRTVSGRVRVEGFRASREQLVRLAEAAQIETREKREHYEEMDRNYASYMGH